MVGKFKFWLATILAIGFLFVCDRYLGEYSAVPEIPSVGSAVGY